MLDCSGKFLNRQQLQPYFDRVRCPPLTLLCAAAAACTAGGADFAGTAASLRIASCCRLCARSCQTLHAPLLLLLLLML